MCARETFDYRTFIALPLHYHRITIARTSHVFLRTFTYKLRANLVYCSCKHGAIIKESEKKQKS